MAATVKVIQSNSFPRKTTEITAFTFATIDMPGSQSSVFSIKKPTLPNRFNYSYWVSLSLLISGEFSLLTNIRVYTSFHTRWNLGTNGGLLLATRDDAINGHGIEPEHYDRARGLEKFSGYYFKDPSNGHSFFKSQEASPINLLDINMPEDAILIDNTIYENTGNEQETKLMVLQLKVGYDADVGNLRGLGIVIIWDEI